MNNLKIAEQLIKRAEDLMDEYNKPLKKDLSTKHFHDIVSRAMTQTEDKLDINILRLKDDNGWTVAHEMANGGYIFTDPEILRLRNKGDTIAHAMAYQGYEFTDPEILRLKDNYGDTVEDIMNR